MTGRSRGRGKALKPNRGGGRFNKSRVVGSVKQGFSKKGTDDYDLDDDFSLVSIDDDWEGQSRKDAERKPRRRYFGPSHKVPLQQLTMSDETKQVVTDVLTSLKADDDMELAKLEIEEKNLRVKHHYWSLGSKLQVVKVHTPKQYNDTSASTRDMFALNSLKRYGFPEIECSRALTAASDDVGDALELLLFDLYTAELSNFKLVDDDLSVPEQELTELREEEIMALSSIYGDTFSVVIGNKLWKLEFDVPMIEKRFNKVVESKKIQKKDKKKVCQYFVKGHCRFGGRCRFSHEIEEELAEGKTNGCMACARGDCVLGEACPLGPPEKQVSAGRVAVEIRFPLTCQYPLGAPLVAVRPCRVGAVPDSELLKISVRLQREAIELVGSPAVYNLVSILEDESELESLLLAPPLRYSLPQPVIRGPNARTPAVKEDEDSSILANELPSYEQMEDTLQVEANATVDRRIRNPSSVSKQNPESINRKLCSQFKSKQTDKKYLAMQEARESLPSWVLRQEIVETVNKHQATVISGMTGCGKTTQVPQFILDAGLQRSQCPMIICTQPRRISAQAVAERVANERAEPIGHSTGYQIRLEAKKSSYTRLLFVTTGVLLRRLETDTQLQGVSHIIIDEVHERSEESDFLLLIIRELLRSGSKIRVILMSATINADLFSTYFSDCPILNIPGRTFPVEEFYLEDCIQMTGYILDEGSPLARPVKKSNAALLDSQLAHFQEDGLTAREPPRHLLDENLTELQMYARYSQFSKKTQRTLAIMDHTKINNDLIEEIINWILSQQKKSNDKTTDGAVLVFLPGLAEITALYEQLNASLCKGSEKSVRLLPLHSTLSSTEQQLVFQRCPRGVTKIVLATNIAETSITIDDVAYVIDSGRMKEKRYDASKGMESLETVWISRANAQQRRGRAGRVQEGMCFRLITCHRYVNHIQAQPTPEIHRVPLEQLILKIKILELFRGWDVEKVLSLLPEAPSAVSVSASLDRLLSLGAVIRESADAKQSVSLTPLGYHLAALPVDVRIGKLILYGAIFRCLDSTLTIAAILSYRTPFIQIFGKRDEVKQKMSEFAVGNSDHLTMLRAYNGWQEACSRSRQAGYNYCHGNLLSSKTLEMLAGIKRQLCELLSDIGFAPKGLDSREMERSGLEDGIKQATGDQVNENCLNYRVLSAVLVAALYPNVVVLRTPEQKYTQTQSGAMAKDFKPEELKFVTKLDGYVSIHPSSINFQVHFFETPYLVFHEKVKTSKIYIRDCSSVSAYALLLLGDSDVSIDLEDGKFIMSINSGWIRFAAASKLVATLLRELRLELDKLLAEKIETPELDLLTCPRGSKVIPLIERLITDQGL